MGLRNRYLYKGHNCFFVTTTCVNWYHLIRISDSYTLIEDSMTYVCDKYNCSILGYVIMPNHVHFILYFNEMNNLSNLMRDFKKYTSVKIRQLLETIDPYSLNDLRIVKQGRVFQIWKDRFDDVYLADKKLLETKLDYIHLNPLQEKWSLVKLQEEYSYSSAMFYNCNKQPGLIISDYRIYF